MFLNMLDVASPFNSTLASTSIISASPFLGIHSTLIFDNVGMVWGIISKFVFFIVLHTHLANQVF